MSFLSKLFGIGGGTDAITAIGNVVDDVFTNDEERAQAQAVLEKLRQQPAALQIALNQVEASHRSVFVAGWRPFVGWVCGFGLAYHFIIQPLLSFVLVVLGVDIGKLPEFDMASLQTILLGMMGLGGLRTFEKIKGKSK